MKLGFLHKALVCAVVAVGLALSVSLPSFSKVTSGGAGERAALTAGESGQVVRIIDGDSLVLASGLKVALSAIQAPKPKWVGKDETKYEAWPLADEARETLRTLTEGKTVKLFYGGDKRDRYGRAVAQVFTLNAKGEPDIWLQEAMVKAGMARVYSWGGYNQDTVALYRAEILARKARRGIWNSKATDGFYDIRKPDPDPLVQYVDSVQIVEGILIKTAEVRGTIYLNFGADYKTDFTIAIPKKSRKHFKKATYDPLTLTGARVRVRGYIELYGGPIIWLNDPERLEVLD